MTEETLRNLISEAVAAGKIGPATIEGVEDCEDFAEFLDYCSEIQLRDICREHGLIARGRDIHDLMDEDRRQRARWAGIR